MGEGVEVFQRSRHETERCQNDRLKGWMVRLEPLQHLVDAFTKRPSNAVEDDHAVGAFTGLPSQLERASCFGDMRSAKRVITTPQYATGAGSQLTPNHPIPRVFPHALVSVSVPCGVPVGVKSVWSYVALHGWGRGEPKEGLP